MTAAYDDWCGCHGDRNVPGCPGCPGCPGEAPSAAQDRVVSMRGWLAARRRFNDLRRLRPWGVGNVVQHPVKVGEGHFDDGQLRIERAWPDA